MTDLADFLLDRIAEDKDRARTFLADNHAALVRAGAPFRAATMAFVVRVLDEWQAKREIVELVTDGGRAPWANMAEANRDVLRLLALPYANHPDYREEWRT